MNPILPLYYHIPDGEAHVMPDGRLYLYGSLDEPGSPDYCSHAYRVFSTADPRLMDWRDDGVSFDTTLPGFPTPAGGGSVLYAPDAAAVGGKTVLYYCTKDRHEGTAIADSPAGPFRDPRPLPPADGDGIDPAVFADEDGSLYYLWGQYSLKMARLSADGRSILPGSVVTDLLTEREHGFHEGSSMRKIGSTYYIVYTDISRGTASCLGYATADKPMGPYRKRGILIDNIGCDPANWNNHGSIECFGGRWFVFYHRASRNSKTSRRMCAEPITVLPDGSIPEVKMSVGGAAGAVDAYIWLEAARACRMHGAPFITGAGEGDSNSYEEWLTACRGENRESWAEYGLLDFAAGADAFRVEVRGHGTLRFALSETGVTASVGVDADDWTTLRAPTENPAATAGLHTLWLLFRGDMEVRGFAAVKGDTK